MSGPTLQVQVLGETGEAVVQVWEAEGYAVLTVRQPGSERLAEVRLTRSQAEALADALGRVPEPQEPETA